MVCNRNKHELLLFFKSTNFVLPQKLGLSFLSGPAHPPRDCIPLMETRLDQPITGTLWVDKLSQNDLGMNSFVWESKAQCHWKIDLDAKGIHQKGSPGSSGVLLLACLLAFLKEITVAPKPRLFSTSVGQLVAHGLELSSWDCARMGSSLMSSTFSLQLRHYDPGQYTLLIATDLS